MHWSVVIHSVLKVLKPVTLCLLLSKDHCNQHFWLIARYHNVSMLVWGIVLIPFWTHIPASRAFQLLWNPFCLIPVVLTVSNVRLLSRVRHCALKIPAKGHITPPRPIYRSSVNLSLSFANEEKRKKRKKDISPECDWWHGTECPSLQEFDWSMLCSQSVQCSFF